MKNIDKFIKKLESNDPLERNEAAVQLMNIGDDRAIKPLLKAIKKVENKNNRGTLIYALSAFDCSELFNFFVKLAFEGNYEVTYESLSILKQQQFKTSTNDISQLKLKIKALKKQKNLPEHRNRAIKNIEYLIEKKWAQQ